MKVTYYKTTTTTIAIPVEVDDDADIENIRYQANVMHDLHGHGEVISDGTVGEWYKEDAPDAPLVGNPLYS